MFLFWGFFCNYLLILSFVDFMFFLLNVHYLDVTANIGRGTHSQKGKRKGKFSIHGYVTDLLPSVVLTPALSSGCEGPSYTLKDVCYVNPG